MISHAIANYCLTSLGIVGLLAWFYLFLKSSSPLKKFSRDAAPGKQLSVKSVLQLEPRKRIYVLGYGEERILVGSAMDKIEFLSTLQSEPSVCLDGLSAAVDDVTSDLVPAAPFGGWMDRFRYSLKTVVVDRLIPTGRK